MARPELPVAPRVGDPDLPDEFDEVEGIAPRDDLLRSRVVALETLTDASHAALTESTVAAASVDRLEFFGATLIDVEIGALAATAVSAREARLRRNADSPRVATRTPRSRALSNGWHVATSASTFSTSSTS